MRRTISYAHMPTCPDCVMNYDSGKSGQAVVIKGPLGGFVSVLRYSDSGASTSSSQTNEAPTFTNTVCDNRAPRSSPGASGAFVLSGASRRDGQRVDRTLCMAQHRQWWLPSLTGLRAIFPTKDVEQLTQLTVTTLQRLTKKIGKCPFSSPTKPLRGSTPSTVYLSQYLNGYFLILSLTFLKHFE